MFPSHQNYSTAGRKSKDRYKELPVKGGWIITSYRITPHICGDILTGAFSTKIILPPLP